MRKVVKLWTYLTELGIAPNMPDHEVIKVKYLNQIIVSTLLLIIVGIFAINIPFGLHDLTKIGLALAVTQSIAYLFSIKGQHQTARNFIIGSDFFIILLGAYIVKGTFNFFVFLFPIANMIFFLVNKKNTKLVLNILLFLSLIALTAIEISQAPMSATSGYMMNFYMVVVGLYLQLQILSFVNKETNIFRKEVREKQKILDEAQAITKLGSWSYNTDTLYISFTDELRRIFKIKKSKNLDFKTDFLTNIPKNYHSLILNTINHHQDNELDFTFKSTIEGRQRWFRLRGRNKIEAENGHRIFYGSIQDISQQKEDELRIEQLLEEVQTSNTVLAQNASQLEKANDDLSRSNTELEQFAYVASHDLQEPLRMVGNFVELLEEEYEEQLDEEGKTYIQFAVDGVRRMSQLIDDLLQYSRVGRSDMKMKPTNLKMVLEKKLLDLSVKIKEENAKVNLKNIPEEILCEPSQLGIVFYNLVNNGIKFNNQSQPVVEVVGESQANDWLFKIQDNGIGIAKKNQDKIFEIFKRLHRKEEYAGTGIGLALVKRIITSHGGKIWLESELGKGTTFYFTVPKQKLN